MLVDCRETSSGTTIRTDLCIIGGGPAGLTIATELDGCGMTVALLERGGPPGAPLGLTEPAATTVITDFDAPPLVPPRFGGGSNEWIVRLPWMRRGVRMLPLSPIDLESRAWIPNSGWPIDWAELERFYRRAHDRLGLGTWGYGVETWEDGESPRLALEPYGFTTAMERFASPGVFNEDAWRSLRKSPNVTVFIHARAGSLEGSSDRVDHVEIDSGTRARLRVEARVFVVTGGGLENPRLLLASREGRGFGNECDVVGRYHMDHQRFISGTITPADRALFERASLYDISTHRSGIAAGKLVPTEKSLRSHEMLHSAAMLLPKPSAEVQGSLSEVAMAARALRRRSRPRPVPSGASLLRTIAYVARIVPEMTVRQRRFPPKTDAGWAHLRGNARRFETFAVEHQVEQAPDPRNRLELGRATDEFGRPVADLTWRWNELDLESIRATQELFGHAVHSAGVGTFYPADWEDHPQLTTPGGAFHPMGGTRMHADPRHGVVDADARVHGVRNLYVAGSSVFPTGGYANPTLTLIALAIRLAGHVDRELSNAIRIAG